MTDLAETAKRFDLYTRDAEAARFVWRFKDSGIAVEPDAIAVMRAGRWSRAPFHAIRSVTLNSAVVGRANVAQCIIQLENGNKVVTSNANDRGLPDGSNDRDFRKFVVALHEQLIASGEAKGIEFRSGYSRTRANVLIGALVAGVALFVVLPLILLILTGEIKALGLLVTGGLLIWPAMKTAEANRPSTYFPDRPPDLIA